VTPPSGKVLSGGIDANALPEAPAVFCSGAKRGRRRVADDYRDALIDTGSRMDDVIFEEFKGTGNMEIYLDRRLADKRVFRQLIFSDPARVRMNCCCRRMS